MDIALGVDVAGPGLRPPAQRRPADQSQPRVPPGERDVQSPTSRGRPARRRRSWIRDETVQEAPLDDQGVAGLRLASGELLTADLYIDCSGFRSALLARALAEPYISFESTLFCDRAVAGGWDRTDEPIKPYTTAETMDCGWCWQIEHEDRVHRGYVYASDFISDDDAEREFRAKNPRVRATRIVKFPSGRYRNSWVKNVVAVGNASGFVEPLESTSLMVIGYECRLLASLLADCDRDPGPASVDVYNYEVGRTWDTIRQFLAIHYRFNSRLDTPFWRACRADVDLAGARPLVEYYQENGPSLLATDIVLPLGRPVRHGGLSRDAGRAEGTLSEDLRALRSRADDLGLHHTENHVLSRRRLRDHRCCLAAIRTPSWRWNPGYYDFPK